MSEHRTHERWLPVCGWPSYQVSDAGRVRSRGRWVTYRTGGSRWLPGKVLKPGRTTAGYARVTLYDGGRRVYRTVHSLVAEAFHGPCPEGQEVRHGPGGMLDNSAANLCYGTRRDNMQDQRRDGTNHESNKTHCRRQHPLRSPNLVPSVLKRGYRSCLACQRAHWAVRNARERRGQVLDFAAEADRRYALIVSEAA